MMREPTTKRLLRVATGLMALPLWMILVGLGGDSGVESVTNPAEQHSAILTDADGASMNVSGMNVSGAVVLVGRLGRGDLSVPFATISSIDITDDPGDFVAAKVTLTDGKAVTLLIRDSMSFYGTTNAGLFQIRARDLARISIEH